MNCKAKTILSPGNNGMPYPAQDDMAIFEDFLNTYCDKTFSTVARLTGIRDVGVITDITIDIFAELRSKREQPLSLGNPLLFKTILRHALLFLRRQKNEDRIELLRSILLCKESFSVLEVI